MAAGQQKKRLVSSSLHEHYKEKKKKKMDSCDYVLNLSPRVYLEWADHQKTVVPKREQIGITWLDMAPFLESVPQSRKGLADVICVPKEIFSLNNLMDVLSYEVWATCLSESERKLLTQFLPGGTVTDEVVHSLLAGENHHFGNSFLTWSSSLCSGSLHPNDVLWKEQQIRTNRKQYYSELNNYHADMLEGLKKWKERWSSCKDPEKLWSKGVTKNKQGTLSISTETAKVSPVPKKAISNKTYIRNGDIAKYMSYIKISKEQHEAFKNLKHSGDGIQTKSLSRVLGDIKRFHVLPFETLVEEEKTRLHEHWLQVVNKDLPVSFEANRKEKMQKDQLKRCLEQEFSEKRALILDQAQTGNLESKPHEQIEDGEPEQQIVNTVYQEDVASAPAGSSHCHYMTCIPALSNHQEPCPIASNQLVVCHDALNSVDNSPVNSLLNGKNDLVEDGREPKSSSSSPKDIWQAVNKEGCKFSNDLSQRQLQPLEERRAPIIDLERDVMEQEAGDSVEASLFSAFATQSQDNLLAFPKGPEILSSYGTHEHMNHMKQPELQFLMANRHLSEPQYPHQLQEQQSLIDHARVKELYMHEIMNKSVFSNGRYPNQEIYSSVNGGLMENNWFPGDPRTHSHWPRVTPSSTVGQCLGGNTDGSLFSVLSGCRNLPSRSIYDATSSEQLMESRNFVPSEDSVYGFASHQFKNSSSHESTAAAPSALNVPWMNYSPQPNSSMQDSMGKPYLRSWNQ